MPLTHRLASKVEETPNTGSGNWNKVTVCIPNSTYILSKVVLQNDQLSIVFDFSDATTYAPAPFAFLLTGFGINTSLLTDSTNFLVLGVQNPTDVEREDSINSFPEWFDDDTLTYKNTYLSERQMSSRVIQFHRCPPNCPPINH